MSKLTKLIMLALFTCAMGSVAPAVYADKGGNPHGQAGKHGHGGEKHGKGGEHGHHAGHEKSEKAHKNIKSEGQKPRIKNEGQPLKVVSPGDKVRFSDDNRAVIVNYFNAHPFGVTSLPPGIAKNVARGKPLPPGIAKRFLPPDLISTLPVYPGYEYLIVDRDVVLVDTATGIVTDILTNLLR